MLKNLFTTLFTLLILGGMVIAQEQAIKEKAPIFMDDQFEYNKDFVGNPLSIEDTSVTTQAWVAVDTMSNTFGPASFNINPLAYDPTSGILSMVHRGNANTYALGSGELWWNYSTDLGQTWVKSSTSVQNGLTSQISARYPSMTVFNPSASTNLEENYGPFAWPELSSSFEYIGWGVTLGFMESALAEIDFDPPTYNSSTPIWTDHQYIYWTSDNADDSSVRLFKTADYGTVEKIDPRAWDAEAYGSGSMTLGGDFSDGLIAHGSLATFAPEVGVGGWEPGVSKSTDNGATWEDFDVIDWLQIPLTEEYEEIWDWKKGDGFVSYAGDFCLDKDGNAHFFVGLSKDVDTVTERGYNTIFEFIQDGNDGWDAKVVIEDLDDDSMYEGPDSGGYATDPAIGQCGPQNLVARNADGDFFVTTWVHHESHEEYCDAYLAFRSLDGEWSQPFNITQSPDLNDNGIHLAPYLHDNGDDTYIAFVMYWYEQDATGLIGALNPSVCYVAPIFIDASPTNAVNGDIDADYNFELSQNYPNPFNPTTSISFSIAERSNVSLKVYDVLGREVANLVSDVMEAGSHNVTFDASQLSSGVYVYEIIAGDFVSSKKMMLMK